MKTNEQMTMTDYKKFRGKCKEFCNELVKNDKTLKLVRGFYYCPIANREEQHWWCVKENGEIIDPTKLQFLSKGFGIYTEFTGEIKCAECGTLFNEEDKNAVYEGNYACCSVSCFCKLVGIN